MSACPGADVSGSEHPGMDVLLEVIKAQTKMPERHYEDPFLFAVDHCFPIKGQGTVLTGTVLRGQVQEPLPSTPPCRVDTMRGRWDR